MKKLILLLKVLSNPVDVLDLVVKLRHLFRSETIQENYSDMNVLDFELQCALLLTSLGKDEYAIP